MATGIHLAVAATLRAALGAVRSQRAGR